MQYEISYSTKIVNCVQYLFKKLSLKMAP